MTISRWSAWYPDRYVPFWPASWWRTTLTLHGGPWWSEVLACLTCFWLLDQLRQWENFRTSHTDQSIYSICFSSCRVQWFTMVQGYYCHGICDFYPFLIYFASWQQLLLSHGLWDRQKALLEHCTNMYEQMWVTMCLGIKKQQRWTSTCSGKLANHYQKYYRSRCIYTILYRIANTQHCTMLRWYSTGTRFSILTSFEEAMESHALRIWCFQQATIGTLIKQIGEVGIYKYNE